jgi:O-antigen/teichoic acid export membrane protein
VSLNSVFLLTFLTPTVAGAALLSSPLVTIMISAQFQEMTIMVLPIAILAAAVRALRVHTSDQTMILLERTRITMYAKLFETVVNVVFCAIGLYFGGIVGAALGVLAGTIAACIASFAYSFLGLGLPAPSGGTLMRIVLATGVMSVVVRLMPAPVNSMTLLLTIAVGATAYAGMIILTFGECRAMIGPIAAKCRSIVHTSFVRTSGNPIDR